MRLDAAEALGLLGDDLRYDARRHAGVDCIVPNDAHWVTVPSGAYRIGSTDGDDDEGPVTPVKLQAFQMAFAPVTQAEFACFTSAGGYQDSRWWSWQGPQALEFLEQGLRNTAYEEELRSHRAEFKADFEAAREARPRASLQYVEGYMVPVRDMPDEDFEREVDRLCAAQKLEASLFKDDPDFNQALQLVVGVSLYEAHAYASWLNSLQSRWRFSLPTEAQWEAAARGPRARRWPWGSPDPGGRWHLNVAQAQLRRSSPVGCFPKADTPEGLVDMAGNVWQWTSSRYAPYPEGALNKASDDDASIARVVRGGSWGNDAAVARSAYRFRLLPIGRHDFLGFRLVRCPIQNPEH